MRFATTTMSSPWDHWLFVDERGLDDQREALEEIFLGRATGSAVGHFQWAWKDSRLMGVSPARIDIDHTPKKGWFRVRDHVAVRVASVAPGQQQVSCVIPGYDRLGSELIVDQLEVAGAGSLAFHFEGVCAYESTFSYAGP